MALWGNKDNLQGPSPVDIVGSASSEFWTASATGLSTITTGTTILLGTEPGEDGFVVLESELSADLFRVGKSSAVAQGAGQVAAYTTQPISLKNDPGYAPASPDGELGRSQIVVGLASEGIAKTGIGTVVAGGIHSGWVGIMTYVDMHGTLRTKSETFVAGSGIATGHRPYPA